MSGLKVTWKQKSSQTAQLPRSFGTSLEQQARKLRQQRGRREAVGTLSLHTHIAAQDPWEAPIHKEKELYAQITYKNHLSQVKKPPPDSGPGLSFRLQDSGGQNLFLDQLVGWCEEQSYGTSEV